MFGAQGAACLQKLVERLDSWAKRASFLAHEASLPGATYQAALLRMGARIDCFTAGQERMFEVFRSARRGGIVQRALRYARANNPRCPGYDTSIPKRWIIHLDMNGLYPWAMTQALQKGSFREVDPSGFTRNFILALPDDGSTGYQLVIDGYVPDHLHDLLADLPCSAGQRGTQSRTVLKITQHTYSPEKTLVVIQNTRAPPCMR
jgi:hypothetical protein